MANQSVSSAIAILFDMRVSFHCVLGRSPRSNQRPDFFDLHDHEPDILLALAKTQRVWTCILAHMLYNVPAAFLLML